MIHGFHAQPSFHAVTHLIMPLSSNVMYFACLPIRIKREYLQVFNIFYLCLVLFVHHASFQGLYLSEVIANLLQSCKLQCRASYTIMQNGTLSVNCSHAILNVRVPKHSLYTSTQDKQCTTIPLLFFFFFFHLKLRTIRTFICREFVKIA